MTNTFDINKYIQLKKDVKQHFTDIKLGEQNLYENQSNLFKPIRDITTEHSKAIQDKIKSNQDTLTNTLVPFTTTLQRRLDQLENLKTLPYYLEEAKSTPDSVILDFNKDFTEDEKNFLASQNLDLPSVVYGKRTHAQALENIKKFNYSIGQSKRYNRITDEQYNKQSAIIKKYKERINQIEEGLKIPAKTGTGIKLLRQKRIRGRPKTKVDAIIYKDANDLIEKLHNFASSYRAGNKGVHNYLVEILDELMKQKIISKSEYDDIHSNIF